jgi:hypothetical protein
MRNAAEAGPRVTLPFAQSLRPGVRDAYGRIHELQSFISHLLELWQVWETIGQGGGLCSGRIFSPMILSGERKAVQAAILSLSGAPFDLPGFRRSARVNSLPHPIARASAADGSAPL